MMPKDIMSRPVLLLKGLRVKAIKVIATPRTRNIPIAIFIAFYLDYLECPL